MNGSGCKNCPVNPCHTLHYRGSYCAEQRSKFGLGDPQTNADRIRAMTGEELAKFLESVTIASCVEPSRNCRASCTDCILDWLQQPAEVDNGQA